MLFRKIIFLVLSVAALSSCSQNQSTLTDTQDHQVPIASLKNKWVIVNYWASWCEGCVKEIPELNHFYQDHAHDVVMYGVNFDQLPAADLKQAVSNERITYPVLLNDPKTLLQLSDVEVLPTTFIIDPHGNVVKSIVGPNTEKSLMKTLLDLQKKYASAA